MLNLNPFLLSLVLLAGASSRWPAYAAEPGDSVVVVYNRRVPESKGLAEYYAQKRKVPREQVLGFDLPVTDTLTRQEFREQLQLPLWRILDQQKLFLFESNAAANEGNQTPKRRLVDARIRYATLCFGVPVRILKDSNLKEEGAELVRAELRRDEAAVDSELACLPQLENHPRLLSFLVNPFYATTNATLLHPTNGILLVARLDGPTAAIARGLVDKALMAETNGLWGRAYFDARGLTSGAYKPGDDWMRGAAAISRRFGLETILDDLPPTFAPGFPMSQIAFYAGWYDGGVSGPFTRPTVEFMPGAFAYHLHSFSGHAIRNPNQHWVGPLLAKGATITMGSVDEPYLDGTPDIATFMGRLTMLGFTFGEAAYAAQTSLSWQTTVVGDPLYRPFGKTPQQQHVQLGWSHSPLIEWSHLRVVNINLAKGVPVAQAVAYLEQQPASSASPVLQEKLGDLYASQGKLPSAVAAHEQVLRLAPTPQQRARVLQLLGQERVTLGRESEAVDAYDQFTKNFPDHPDLLAIHQKRLPLLEKLQRHEAAERCRNEIKRLTAP
jgi:uncharacterized protein (TIGR03790 family)